MAKNECRKLTTKGKRKNPNSDDKIAKKKTVSNKKAHVTNEQEILVNVRLSTIDS